MKPLSTNYTYSFIYQAMRTCFCFHDYTTVIPYRSQPGRVIGCLTWHRCSWMMLAAKDRIHLQYSELGVFFQFSHMFFIGIVTHTYIYIQTHVYIYIHVRHHFPTSCRSPLRVFSPGSLGAHVSVPSLVRHLENGCDWWCDWVEL